MVIERLHNTLEEELRSLSNLRTIKEDRIERLKLPSGLIDRMNATPCNIQRNRQLGLSLDPIYGRCETLERTYNRAGDDYSTLDY